MLKITMMLFAGSLLLQGSLFAQPADTCTDDSDCVLISGCCGCNTLGGEQTAAHKSVMRKMEDCSQVSCAQGMSTHESCKFGAKAKCVDGSCQIGFN
jgi:hypothetical protein